MRNHRFNLLEVYHAYSTPRTRPIRTPFTIHCRRCYINWLNPKRERPLLINETQNTAPRSLFRWPRIRRRVLTLLLGKDSSGCRDLVYRPGTQAEPEAYRGRIV